MKAFKYFISDAFSIVTIVLCLVLKIPQIIRIIESRNATGVSLKALFMELTSYSITMTYNYCNQYSLMSYLEYPILVFQEYVLIGLIMHFKKFRAISFFIILMVYILLPLLFANKLFDKAILTVFLPFLTPISATSKILQLMEIFSMKNANSVSVLTWFLSTLTNVLRIYTVFLDSADFYLLSNFVISSFLSGSVMFSAIYYQRLTKNKSTQKETKTD